MGWPRGAGATIRSTCDPHRPFTFVQHARDVTEVASSILLARRRPMALSGLRRHVPLGSILALSATLNGWALSNAGWGNAYYSAAVRSMTQSWHNFVFASFEPGGFVSVDKPPLSLWVQTISAKLFGFRPLSLLIPQVIAGVASVWFVYAAVRRVSTSAAALTAALFLAVTPIHVMVSHSNNLDAVLICVMSGAAYLAIAAAQSGTIGRLLGASVVGGLAMTAKMLAGVPVMPGIVVAFLWCAPISWRRRTLGAVASIVVMTVVGLWWFVLVDLTPKSARPYVGSSATNSSFQLAFERNGANQVDGTQAMGGGPGRGGRAGGFPGRFPGGLPGGLPSGFPPGVPAAGNGGAGMNGLFPGVAFPPGPANGTTNGSNPRAAPNGASGVPNFPGGRGFGPRGGRAGFGIPRLGFSGGQPGVLRLLNSELGSQIAWFLPLTLIGGLMVLARRRFRPSPDVAAAIVFGGWFAIAAGAFSITKGIVHPYYLASVGPPAAALAGLGVGEGLAAIRSRQWRWAVPLLGALAATAAVQWTVLRRPDSRQWRPFLVWAALAVVVLGLVALAAWVRRLDRTAQLATVGTLGLVVLSPLLWTQSSLANGVTPQLPYAQATGLDAGRAGLQPNGGFTFPAGDQKRLVTYLRSARTTERWLVAVQSAGQAEAIIITSGEPVMTLGGFIGSDPILTAKQLRTRITNGDVRFFLVGGAGGPGGPGGPGGFGRRGGFGVGSSSAFVSSECAKVPPELWQSGNATTGETSFAGGPTSASFTLYDCGSLRTAD